MESMLLQDLVIGSFSWLTELTGTVHPSPEIFSRSDDIVGDIVQDIIELIIAGICCEIRVLVIGLNLEQRIAFASR